MSSTKRGMTISKTLAMASDLTGIQVKRNPHATGSVGNSGGSRSTRHDHGNQQAINTVKQKIKQDLGDSTYFQSSQVRTRNKQAKQQMQSTQLDKRSQKAEQLSKMYSKQPKKNKDFDPWTSGNPNRPTSKKK